MKKIIMLLMLLFLTTSTVFGQTSRDQQLCKKWIIDKEAMKPVIIELLMASPQMAEFDKEMKKITIDNAVNTLARLKMHIQPNGKMLVQNDAGKDMGIWRFNADKTELYTQSSDGKTKENFLVETLTTDRLVLVGKKNVKLIFRRL
jgi:hypothetical protein